MANNKVKAKKIKASDMLFLAVIAYLCQLVEPIIHYVIKWTPLIDNVPLGDKWWTLILRVLCCAVWGIAVVCINYLSVLI